MWSSYCVHLLESQTHAFKFGIEKTTITKKISETNQYDVIFNYVLQKQKLERFAQGHVVRKWGRERKAYLLNTNSVPFPRIAHTQSNNKAWPPGAQ